MSVTESPPVTTEAAVSPGHIRQRGSLRRMPATGTPGPVSYRLGFAGRAGARGTAWQVLEHGQFRRYFIASVVSNFGTWLQNTAQVLLAYQLGRSVFFVGLVTCVQFSAPLLFGTYAGVLAGRIGPRRTLIGTQVLSAAIAGGLAGLWFTHALSEQLLLAGAFLAGLMFTFTLPAQSVIVPALVPPAEANTKAAMVMNSVSYNVGRAVAPAIGILVVTTVSFGWAFAINAMSFGIFAVVLLTVHACEPLPEQKRSRVRDCLDIARNDRKIIILLLMVAAVTIAEDPLLVLGPGLARQSGMSADWAGYFLSAMGAGSVIGSALPRRKAPSVRRTATALGILGIFVMAFALAPSIWFSVPAAFGAGMAGLVAGSAAQAKLQELAGRKRALQVMGLWAVAWAGSKPIASIIDGLLPSLVHLRATGVLMAVPALIPIVVLLFLPGWGEANYSNSSPIGPSHLFSRILTIKRTGFAANHASD